MKINKVCIIGLGLMGGSLAMAIKKKKLARVVIGTSRRASTIKKAVARKIVDVGILSHKEAVKDANIIFISTPINKIIPTLKEIAGRLKKGAIVTDIGSTKSFIVKEAEKIIRKNAHFAGGHPMAGLEKTGLDVAIPNLYDNTTYILTPTKNTDIKALRTLEVFLKKLNVKVLKLSPEKQDLLVSGISHLPLAVAASLVNAIASMGSTGKEMAKVASSGFRDTTRVASGDPVLGLDLFDTNKTAVLKMIGEFKKAFNKMEMVIRGGNKKKILAELTKAKKSRDRIYK